MRLSRKRSRVDNALDDVRTAIWLTRGLVRMRMGRAPWRSGSRRAGASWKFRAGR